MKVRLGQPDVSSTDADPAFKVEDRDLDWRHRPHRSLDFVPIRNATRKNADPNILNVCRRAVPPLTHVPRRTPKPMGAVRRRTSIPSSNTSHRINHRRAIREAVRLLNVRYAPHGDQMSQSEMARCADIQSGTPQMPLIGRGGGRPGGTGARWRQIRQSPWRPQREA